MNAESLTRVAPAPAPGGENLSITPSHRHDRSTLPDGAGNLPDSESMRLDGVGISTESESASADYAIGYADDRSTGSSEGIRPSHGRGRVLTGSVLFVLGFSAVFVSYGVVFGGLGSWLLIHQRQISVVMGVMVIIMGLGYLGLPGLSNRMWWNADRRSHARPSRGLWGAPLLGVLFGLGWTPCIGPTLAAVQTLAFTEASAVRGAVLSLAYCLGLGLPFIGMALGLRAVAGATAWTRKHYLAIARFGGAMLITIGVLLLTGWWNDIVAWLQGFVPGFTAVV